MGILIRAGSDAHACRYRSNRHAKSFLGGNGGGERGYSEYLHLSECRPARTERTQAFPTLQPGLTAPGATRDDSLMPPIILGEIADARCWEVDRSRYATR